MCAIFSLSYDQMYRRVGLVFVGQYPNVSSSAVVHTVSSTVTFSVNEKFQQVATAKHEGLL
jgi:hypothetical protein